MVTVFTTALVSRLIIRISLLQLIERTVNICYIIIKPSYSFLVFTRLYYPQAAEIGLKGICKSSFHVINVAFLQERHGAMMFVFVGQLVVHTVTYNHVIHQRRVLMTCLKIAVSLPHNTLYRRL